MVPRAKLGWVLSAFIGCATGSASTVYEAVRQDAQTSHRDLDVKIWTAAAQTRIDIWAAGRLRVSFIETGDNLAIVDHLARVYVSGKRLQDAAPTLAARAWRTTLHHLFALGSYCPTIELQYSSVVRFEQCASATDDDKSSDGVAIGPVMQGTRAGDFLRAVLMTRDPDELFERVATEVLQSAPVEPGIPFVIRYFEDGKLHREFRVLRSAHAAVPRALFSVPGGLRRIARPSQ